ncbi:galactofuranosylgalactofuranosylrhamnosyl-N-acetylglucosaminyl-diphospho-decaprenol beta-1,5/1,6-galactofuranosyltransferase [Ruaniaceae bacterium KH17]|nr:galactofuranosylgalactofuranosylrhamnosyl-N-acetylglucosaminyl-diphospho-decaprenol beta-1,5/1,6-galactofuranosyltransferase [Ruaniaceae bacterium KH17]
MLSVEEIWLEVRAAGSLDVVGYRSDGRRDLLHESFEGKPVPPLSASTHSWIAVEAHDGTEIEELIWSADVEAQLPGVVAVVPTFRREEDATHQAESFLKSALVTRVIVIDQGGTLRDHTMFRELLAAHPERLQFMEQPNLGGSGGYARGMIESLSDPECAVLLSDDDAALPEESLRRMLIAQALAGQRGRKLVMATPMFSAEEPTRLISAAEYVDRRTFQWGAADGLRDPLSVASATERLVSALDMQHTPDYAGWWGALLPPGIVAEVGLPAPYFLKWDDAEYGLRARKQGYEVMALPGTGVWHPTWGVQKTLTTWVAVLLHRNRLATAAAYGAGKGVIRDSFVHQIKHVLSLQYDVAELWAAGIDQFLDGPEWLGTDLANARNAAQASEYQLPTTEPRGDIPERQSPLRTRKGVLRAIAGTLRKPNMDAETSGSVNDFTWRDGLGMDRVVITNGDGTVSSELVRDPRRARSLLSRAAKQHWMLMRRWHELSGPYASRLKDVTTAEHWRGLLRANS